MSEKILYLDCPTGLSGDMLLAALIACGADEKAVERGLAGLNLPGWRMESGPVQKQGLAAHKIDFICADEQQHRHLAQILAIIEAAGLPPRVQALACRAFAALAEAEAAAHGCTVEEVHFHEVGAADAILDICGVSLALDMLGITQVYCAPLPLSSGFVECAHGRLPVPAPAVLRLLEGYQFYDSGLNGELITPTGAALLRAAEAQQSRPPFTLIATGLGAGTRELPMPNILRALLGQAAPNAAAGLEQDEIEVLTANIDDSSGEALAYLCEQLLAAGAVDAGYAPLIMKKGRPGWQLQVLAPPALARSLAALVFAESSTLGLRRRRESRLLLPRESRLIDTPYGQVSIKFGGNNICPEYEDVARAARQAGLPFKQVYQEILSLALKQKEEI